MKIRRAAPHSVWADDVNVWHEARLRKRADRHAMRELRAAELRDIETEKRAERRATRSRPE